MYCESLWDIEVEIMRITDLFSKRLMQNAGFRPLYGMEHLSAKKKFGSANGTANWRNDWHTAFFEALQMELREYQGILEFHYQHHLTAEPLRIDCVVIKKIKNTVIKKNIAAIFRKWNLFEYKNPGDYVSIADFYKVYGYACLYTSFENIPIKDLTVSFVQSRYPRKLLRHLQDERGYVIAETSEGIYTVSGDILPIQIIDSRKLPADEYLWLKSLRDNLDYIEVTKISEEIIRQDKAVRIAAYRNVITEANTESIQEAMEMSQRKQKLTVDQLCENVGWAAKWEAKGEERKAFSIAQNMVKLGLPLETVVSATQLEPEKVRPLYRG
jgi:hypothetical protein